MVESRRGNRSLSCAVAIPAVSASSMSSRFRYLDDTFLGSFVVDNPFYLSHCASPEMLRSISA